MYNSWVTEDGAPAGYLPTSQVRPTVRRYRSSSVRCPFSAEVHNYREEDEKQVLLWRRHIVLP